MYSFTDDERRRIRDAGPAATVSVPSFLEDDDRISGLAYDPFTDHFFLRLEPGNVIRVVDRPARAIKREFTIAGAPEVGGGDLAIRPRDGHVFLLHPRERAVLETTRLGQLRRTIPLAGLRAPAAGVAYDADEDRLLVLEADGQHVGWHRMDGTALNRATLERRATGSLAFDRGRRELYAPLADGNGTIGVFAVSGKLLRTIPVAARLVDLGERSLIRVF